MDAATRAWLDAGIRRRPQGELLPLAEAAARMGRSVTDIEALALAGVLYAEGQGEDLRVRPVLLRAPVIVP